MRGIAWKPEADWKMHHRPGKAEEHTALRPCRKEMEDGPEVGRRMETPPRPDGGLVTQRRCVQKVSRHKKDITQPGESDLRANRPDKHALSTPVTAAAGPWVGQC